MFFVEILLIFIALTCVWQNGETGQGSSRHKSKMAVEYNNLMNIDTGYSYTHENIKNAHVLYTLMMQEEITESTVAESRAKVYRNLLCSYMFTCRYYMYLIKILVDQARKSLLEAVFEHDIYKSSEFQYQIVGMLFVLKQLGTVNHLEPLWLMYVYLECLKTISIENVTGQQYIRRGDYTILYDLDIRQLHIKQSVLISYDHDIIYETLTRFVDNNCHADSMYNHQHGKSNYFKQLEKLNLTAENAESLVRNVFFNITATATNRYYKTKQILSIGDNGVYFLINDLRLHSITLNDDIIVTLLKKFAEMLYWTNVQETVHRYCSSSHLKFYSVRKLVVDVRQCLAMFVNLMKYIIARNVMKYVLDVHSTLPDNCNQSTDVLARWISQNNIKTTNETMLNCCKDIISFLKLDHDEEMKFVVEMFSSEPQVTFSDPKKIADNEHRIKNILEKCLKVLYNFPSLVITRADLDPSNKSKRRAKLLKLAKLHGIEVSDSDGKEYEGMLDLFVFRSYISELFADTNFDIALSFFEFSENIYN